MQHHEGVIEHLGKTCAGPLRERMVGGGDQYQAVGAVGDEFDVGALDQIRDHADIDLAARHGHDHFGAGVLLQADGDLRVALQEGREAVRQKGMGGMGVGPQADVPAHAFGVGREVGVHLFELGEHLARMAQQGLASAGQADATGFAQQQRGADRLFQQAHAVAGRRRRQVHALGTAGQVLRFGNRDKKA
ncbi:hypothetical protein D9M68_846340 [compost metagenome]